MFLPLFSADSLKLCQLGWGVSLHSYFQVSPEMFDWVQALAGPLQDIQRLVPKPLLRCLGCVLRVVVLLEVEPSPQSKVLSALEHVSSRISLYFAPFIFPSILTSLPVPATEKHSHRDGARVPPDVTLGIQAKEFNLGFIRPEIMFLMVCDSLGPFWGKSGP